MKIVKNFQNCLNGEKNFEKLLKNKLVEFQSCEKQFFAESSCSIHF